jgi:DNA-binding CsgD family transcriptional regulator
VPIVPLTVVAVSDVRSAHRTIAAFALLDAQIAALSAAEIKVVRIISMNLSSSASTAF